MSDCRRCYRPASRWSTHTLSKEKKGNWRREKMASLLWRKSHLEEAAGAIVLGGGQPPDGLLHRCLIHCDELGRLGKGLDNEGREPRGTVLVTRSLWDNKLLTFCMSLYQDFVVKKRSFYTVPVAHRITLQGLELFVAWLLSEMLSGCESGSG